MTGIVGRVNIFGAQTTTLPVHRRPVRPVAVMTLGPVDAGTRVATEVALQTRGIGKVLGIPARTARRGVHVDLEYPGTP